MKMQLREGIDGHGAIMMMAVLDSHVIVVPPVGEMVNGTVEGVEKILNSLLKATR